MRKTERDKKGERERVTERERERERERDILFTNDSFVTGSLRIVDF